MSDTYSSDFIDAGVRSSLNRSRSAGAAAATDIEGNPDEAARAQQLSIETGVPASVINGDLESFERTYKGNLNRQIVDNDPVLQEYINSNPMAVKVSHDDFHVLAPAIDAIKNIGAAGVEGFATGFDYKGFLNEQQKLRDYVDNPAWRLALLTPQAQQVTALASVPDIASRFFGGLLTGGAQALGESFYQMSGSRAWADRLTRDLFALGQVSMAEGMAGPRVAPELNVVARGAREAPKPFDPVKVDAELQKLNDGLKAAEPWLQNGQLPPRGVHEIFDEAWKDASKEDLKNLDTALNESSKSATRERSPELFANLAKQIVGNGKIEIDAEAIRKIYGEDVPVADDGKLGWIPNLREQLEAAEPAGGSIEVPLSEYLARIDPELAKELRDDIRVRPQGLTNNEIEAFDAKREAEAKEREERFEPEGGSPPKDEVEGVRRVAGLEEPLFSQAPIPPGWQSVETRPGEGVYRNLLPETAEKGGEIPHPREGGQAVSRVAGTTLGELLDRINFKDQDEATQMLSEFYGKRLKELVGNTPVHIVAEKDMPTLMSDKKRNPPGYYSPLHNHIVLADYLVNGEMPDWYSAKVIMHEGDHAVNSPALLKYPVLDAATRMVMKDADLHISSRSPKARKEFNYAFHGDSSANEGATYNSREFMAEVRSRPALRKWLAQAPASPETVRAVQKIADALGIKDKVVSTWDAVRVIFKDLYNRVFGRIPKDSVLDQVFKLSEILEDANSRLDEMAQARGVSKGELLKSGYADFTEKEPSSLKLTPAERKYFEEIITGKYGIEDEVPSIKLIGDRLEWDPKHSGQLINWIDESRSMRQAGERLPPSFYQGSQFIKRMQNIPNEFLVGPLAAEGDKPLFGKMAIGMNKRWQEKYFKLIDQRNAEDMERQFKVAEREERQRQTEQWKKDAGEMYNEVRNDFQGRPDIAIGSFFNEGRLFGQKIADRPILDTTKLSPEQKALLPKVTYGRGGLDPDDLAGAFGLRSGDELVQVLAQMQAAKGEMPFRQYVDTILRKEVSRRMLGRFGDLEENIMNEAIEHVIGSTQMDILHEELVGLGMRLNRELPFTKEDTKAFAKSKFETTPVGQITLEKMLRDAGKAGTDAELALLDNKPDEAFQAKQKQYLSMRMAEEAKKFEREQRRFDKLTKQLSARDQESIHPEYVGFIHQIMVQIGRPVRRSIQDLQDAIARSGYTNLEALVQAKEGALREMPVADFLFDPNYKKTTDAMTVGEFRAVMNSIKTLVHNGRDEMSIEVEGAKRDLEEVLGEMKGRLEALGKDKAPRVDRALNPVLRTIRTYWASSLTTESLLNRWDRDDPRGIFNRYIVYPLAEAANHEARLIREYQKELREAAGDIKDIDKKIANDLFIDPLDGQPLELRKRNVLGILQNIGNRSNLEKLSKGYGLEPDQVIQWVIQNTTKEDWDRAQRIGDVFAKLTDLADTMADSISGVTFEKIPIESLQTPYGQYRGWYNPIKYDPNRPGRSKRLIGPNALEEEGYFRATTPQGYTKGRTGYIAPVELNLDVVPLRIKQMIHDIAFRPAVLQTSKVFYDSEFQRSVIKNYGEVYAKQLVPYLKDVANFSNSMSDAAHVGSKAIEWFRQNLISTLIGFNPHTVAKHGMTAAVNSLTEVGPLNFMREFSGLLMNSEEAGKNNWQFAMEHSEELQRRLRNWSELIQGQPEISLMRASVRDFMIAAGSTPVGVFDLISAVPTWLAQYRTGIEEGLDHGQAVAEGNRAVRRAHGSSVITNRSQIQRASGLAATFSSLYGFFSHMLQKQFELAWKASDSFQGLKAGDLSEAKRHAPALILGFFSYIIAPAIVEELVTPYTNSDRDSWGVKAAKSLLKNYSASFIGARDFVDGIVNWRDPSAGLIATAMKMPFELARDLSKGKQAFNKEHAGKLIKDAFSTVGLLRGVTTTQQGKAAEFIYRYNQGLEHPKGLMDWAHGLTRGTLRENRR